MSKAELGWRQKSMVLHVVNNVSVNSKQRVCKMPSALQALLLMKLWGIVLKQTHRL